ncbi:hypothetical protein [Mycobacterium lehmannii]|uniref:hypothetical protein n=1 Tax=Mycobacterium lehmannii TaxID=2048550 RepID=UPI000B945F3B|nr:hypothetical protein [Mycobacterium lehmannii]
MTWNGPAAAPAHHDWTKDGSWVFTTHGPDCVHLWAQSSALEAPQMIGTRTAAGAISLALGLLRAAAEYEALDAAIVGDAARLIAEMEARLAEGDDD